MYGCGTLRGSSTLLRRSSIQANKPPPPIRRTASITNTNKPLTPVSSVENLPPPPAYLLEPNKSPQQQQPTPVGINVAETIKALNGVFACIMNVAIMSIVSLFSRWFRTKTHARESQCHPSDVRFFAVDLQHRHADPSADVCLAAVAFHDGQSAFTGFAVVLQQ